MVQSPLVSTDWLADRLGDTSIVPIDATWHMPDTGRSASGEYQESHIAGAVFFDIDEIADTQSDLPHTFPNTHVFQSAVRALGISNDDTLIVYDNSPSKTAARTWWMFRAMGHDKVYMLDGGFQKWTAEGRETTSENTSREESYFVASYRPELFRDTNGLVNNISSKQEQVVDARAAGRFDGSMPEPRAGLRGGHIPGAQSLPFLNLYNEDNTLKGSKDLKEAIAAAGVDLEQPIVTSCGSGVTACNLALAFALLGKWDVAVYDGSWTEWGGNPRLPIER